MYEPKKKKGHIYLNKTDICLYIIHQMTYKDQNGHLQQARRSTPSSHTLAMTSTRVHLPIYVCTSSSTPTCLQAPILLCPHAPSGRSAVVHPQPCHVCLTPHVSEHARKQTRASEAHLPHVCGVRALARGCTHSP